MIQLELTIEETNTVLTALGKRPYEDVFQVINKIQQQAQTQLPSNNPEVTNG